MPVLAVVACANPLRASFRCCSRWGWQFWGVAFQKRPAPAFKV